MGAAVTGQIGVIEVLNRSGQVLQRIPYSGGDLRVGRAYDNDIIVGDPYVCPHHLLLTAGDGSLFAKDLESLNGTYIGSQRDRITEAQIRDGSLIHLGHSLLRFHAVGEEVAPAWLDTARHGIMGLFGSPWTLLIAVMLALTTMTIDNLLDTAQELGPGVLVSQLLYPIIGVFMWAGFWSLLNRVISHRANLHVHLAIACLGISGLFVSYHLVSLSGFAFGLDPAVPLLRWLGRIAVFSLVLYAHLRYATHGRTGLQAVVAALGGVLLLGTPAVGEFLERSEFNSMPQLNPLLKPPAFQIKGGKDVQAFLEEAQVLREKADDAAAE